MATPTITDRRGDDRRGFLRKSLLAGATAGSAGLLLGGAPALAKRGGDAKLADPTAGDIAILKFSRQPNSSRTTFGSSTTS